MSPVQSAELTIPADPSAISGARRFAQRCLDDWGLDRIADTAVLLISEIVTNAIIHGRSPAELTLILDREMFRAEVRDASTIPPHTRHYSAEATTGRGMLIVEALSSDWGSDTSPGGKVVWFELMLPGPGGRVSRSGKSSATGMGIASLGGAAPSTRPTGSQNRPLARALVAAGV